MRREEIETAAVVTRVAPSFIRFGHFEHFAASERYDELRALADFVIDRFYPACRASERFGGNAYAALLEAVSERTAALMAQWQAVGFCHGVMNTDNMSILGLTIDYGPVPVPRRLRSAPHLQPQRHRRALRLQPAAQRRLLEPVLPGPGAAAADRRPGGGGGRAGVVQDGVPATRSSAACAPSWACRRRRDGDRALVEGVLKLLAQEKVDYTIFWRRLSRHVAGDDAEPVRDLFLDRPAFDAWLLAFSERHAQTPRAQAADLMLETNPKFVLRNHLGQQAIEAAQRKDFSGVANLLTLLETPFDEHPGHETYAGFPPDWASTIEISCSS